MLYNKPPTKIAEQIELLKARGMAGDESKIKRWLETVGYYRLSVYWLPFEELPAEGATRSKQFKPDTMFETIIDIYMFDRKLRLLVMEAVERVEIALRSRWTNRLSLAHGAHAHLASEAFKCGYDHIGLLSKLANRTKDSNEIFVKHYGKNYDEPFMPPLWVVTELMTFGELSKWYAATRDTKVKAAVAKDLGLPTQEVLDGTLKLLCYIRNICAHHGRLWNRRTVFRLPLIKRFRENLEVVETATEKGVQTESENFIYNALVILILMLKHQSGDTTFPKRLTELIRTRSSEQQKVMGFPKGWQNRPCWKLD
jgi:abortive infection bacteriophage resistance protein